MSIITEHMQMTSRRDAGQWAGSYNLAADQTERLADWIWTNNPYQGCPYAEHPFSQLSIDEFWSIAEGDEA